MGTVEAIEEDFSFVFGQLGERAVHGRMGVGAQKCVRIRVCLFIKS